MELWVQIAGVESRIMYVDADGHVHFEDLDLNVQDGVIRLAGTQIQLSDLSNGTAIPPANLNDQYEYQLLPISWFSDGATAPAALDDASTRSPYKYRNFDGASQDEDLDTIWQLPDHINLSEDVCFRVYYLVTNATGPSSEGVVFQVQATSIGDNDPTNPAQGAAVPIADTGTTAIQWDLLITGWSTDVTISNGAAGELVEINFYRDYDHASDTYTQDVGVCFVEFRYKRNPQ